MAYDPRQMMAIGRMGLGMMSPQPSPFDRNTPGRTPQWWEQPLPQRKDQPADQDADPSQAPNAPKQPQPSLLQMLMLGGPATYSGTPRPGGAPSGSYGAIPSMGPSGMNFGGSPWAWLGGVGWGGAR